MSLDSMAIATDGYVSRTVKKALVIAVAGYLNFGGTPIPIKRNSSSEEIGGVSSGGGNVLSKRLKSEKEWMFFIKIYTEQCL